MVTSRHHFSKELGLFLGLYLGTTGRPVSGISQWILRVNDQDVGPSTLQTSVLSETDPNREVVSRRPGTENPVSGDDGGRMTGRGPGTSEIVVA